MNRLLPSDLTPHEFNSRMSFLLNEVIGRDNIGKIKSKKFNDLLNREDPLASIELYTIADAAYKLRNESNSEWFLDFGKAITRLSDDEISSKAFELISASMFADYQTVILSDVSQAGYDFVIQNEGVDIRVSCKKLMRSDEHKRFLDECDALFSAIGSSQDMLSGNAVQMNLVSEKLYASAKSDVNFAKSKLTDIVQAYGANGRKHIVYSLRNSNIAVLPLLPWNDGWSYTESKLSYVLRVGYKHPSSEQKRFEDLFRRAAKNLKKHSSASDKNIVNVIMIGVPEYVSLATAEKWASAKFNKDYSSIALALLYRCVPCRSNDDISSTVISNEFKYVFNPNYISLTEDMLRKMALKSTVTFGTISDHDSVIVLVDRNGVTTSYPDYFVYQRGLVNLERPVGEGDFHVEGQLGVELHIKFVSNDGDICPPLPERPKQERFAFI